MKCASNLRQIGQAILLYSNDHSGMCPATIAQLVRVEELDPNALVCPTSTQTKPIGASLDQISAAASDERHCSYRYLADGLDLRTLPANAVLAYESPADHDGDGSNVLFGDGHVEFMTTPNVRTFEAKLIRQATRVAPATMSIQ